jgi:radical SAM superfamily enzyme YgiQ (UPF0313 family)
MLGTILDKEAEVRTRVLLVYPEIPPTYWSLRYALPFVGRKAAFPPLGLLTVAAMLPEDFEVRLVDMNVEPLRESAVAAADLVFTSSMLVQRASLERVIGLCRSLGRPVVAGGPHPTSCHAEIQGVDHFVLGEAETSLPSFLADYAAGRPRPLYEPGSRPDLALTPPPRFDLLRRGAYACTSLQFSRGCPHHCEFCDIVELFGHKPRTKSPDQMLREFDRLYGAGWRGSLFLVDDNFIGNHREVRQLLPQLERWQREHGHPFELFTEASLELASDADLQRQMVAAGFNMVFLGIETPDACTLKAVGKEQNLRTDMLAGIHRIQKAGMEVSGGFIVGFDSDTEDVFDRQVRFIQEAGIPTAMVGLLNALPKTRLHRRLQAEQRLTAVGSGGDNTALRLNFIPRMDPGRLLDGYKRLLATLYSPERYFERCLALLRTLKRHRASTRTIRLPELRALGLSLLVQTFSRYGWSYWKFLVRGFLARPRLAAEAVTMAVKGHHFFKITRNLLELDRFQGNLERLAKAFEARVAAVTEVNRTGALADLRAWRDRATAQMRKAYRRLNKDFQRLADGPWADFQARLDRLVERAAAGPRASRQES